MKKKMASLGNPPPLVRLPFMAQEDVPKEIWYNCEEKQKKWDEELCSNEAVVLCMKKFRKQKALSLVWLSNEMEGTLPEGVSQLDTFKLLEDLYEKPSSDAVTIPETGLSGKNAENSSLGQGQHQLIQHLMAYKHLCESVDGELSEDLVKGTHKILMDGLTCEDGSPLHSGEYRLIRVHAGNHAFPDSDCVPDGMARIVAEYNSKAAVPHDPFQLASWLLYQVVSLHPFEDGNGRMCRLLWCYSLMRDGLPFPPTISSGRRKAQKHFVWAIERSRCYKTSDYPHLTTLTVISVQRAWCNFFCNLQFELVT